MTDHITIMRLAMHALMHECGYIRSFAVFFKSIDAHSVNVKSINPDQAIDDWEGRF